MRAISPKNFWGFRGYRIRGCSIRKLTMKYYLGDNEEHPQELHRDTVSYQHTLAGTQPRNEQRGHLKDPSMNSLPTPSFRRVSSKRQVTVGVLAEIDKSV